MRSLIVNKNVIILGKDCPNTPLLLTEGEEYGPHPNAFSSSKHNTLGKAFAIT